METHEEGLCGVVISAIAFAWMGPLGSADRHLTVDAARPAYWGLGGLGLFWGGVQLPGVLGHGRVMNADKNRTDGTIAGGWIWGMQWEEGTIDCGGGVPDLRWCRLRCP